MNVGHFYFIKNQYFIDFPDPYIMGNHETINGISHNRPCFYSFEDNDSHILWVIPISSKIAKFRREYNKNISKYNRCDTIDFSEILGQQRAFLIQNMCPITTDYISNEYVDTNNDPIKINRNDEQRIINKAKRVLRLQRKGTNLIFPDVLTIEKALIQAQTKNDAYSMACNAPVSSSENDSYKLDGM